MLRLHKLSPTGSRSARMTTSDEDDDKDIPSRFSARRMAVTGIGALLLFTVVLLLLLVTNPPSPSATQGWARKRLTTEHPAVVSSSSSTHLQHHLSFQLAMRESFGFFDDLSDEDWKERQQQARNHRHQIGPNVKTKVFRNEDMWVLHNYYPLFSCPRVVRVGWGGDGPKWVCDPHRLRKKAGQCLVYSVGCSGNYLFEDALVDLVGNGTCEIHVFDILPRFDRPKWNAPRNIHFHPWGIKSSYHHDENDLEKTTDKGDGGVVMMTLQDTMKKLGHEGRTIDVFKIDCEGCEWTTYKDWIGDGVDIRQIQVETHGHATAMRVGVRPSDFFDDLQSAGFAMFYKEPNIHPRAADGLSEWSFVRLDKSFFGYEKSNLTNTQ